LRRRGAVFCSVTTCGVSKARHVTICKTIHESSDCTVSARIIRGSFVAATAPMLQAAAPCASSFCGAKQTSNRRARGRCAGCLQRNPGLSDTPSLRPAGLTNRSLTFL
jgi:hypothetical protein